MDDFNIDVVAKKSIHGIATLISRSFFVQILSLLSNFVLTIALDPAMIGVFFVASSINMFLSYFQDIGLAAVIIQQKDHPTKEELRTTFTIQQVLVFLIVIPVFLFSKQIGEVFHFSQEGLWVLYAYLFSFILSSLKTIPTVLLERKLDFQKLVIPQLVENTVYSLALIICALKGFGINTFTIAILLRSIVGLPIIYMIQPWSIGFAYKKEIFKKLISHGSPFQGNSILALVKDDLLNLYVASVLPLAQVGYIGFGQKWAFQPLRLIMDNVIKVTFPSYSRLQHDREALRKVVEKSLFLIAFFIFPIVVGFIVFSPSLIDFIPGYQKWQPAVLALAFFSVNTLFASISVPLTNLLNAIGKVKITLRYMVGWTILAWILTPFFIRFFGYNGVPLASAIVAASVLVILIPVKKQLSFSFLGSISKQAVASIALLIFSLIVRNFAVSLETTIILIIISGAFYIFCMYLLAKQDVIQVVQFVLKTVKREK